MSGFGFRYIDFSNERTDLLFIIVTKLICLAWVRGHGAYLAVRGRAKSLI